MNAHDRFRGEFTAEAAAEAVLALRSA